MRVDHTFTKDGRRVVSTTLTWLFHGGSVSVEVEDDAHAFYSDKLEKIVVELFRHKKIAFYSESGDFSFDIPMPSLDGYSFWGLNKNFDSVIGVSVIFNPEAEGKKTEWNDMVQYELLTTAPYVGKYLYIYR